MSETKLIGEFDNYPDAPSSESPYWSFQYVQEGGKHRGYYGDGVSKTKEESIHNVKDFAERMATEHKSKMTVFQGEELIIMVDHREGQDIKTSNI